jgi:hypothetical protein
VKQSHHPGQCQRGRGEAAPSSPRKRIRAIVLGEVHPDPGPRTPTRSGSGGWGPFAGMPGLGGCLGPATRKQILREYADHYNRPGRTADWSSVFPSAQPGPGPHAGLFARSAGASVVEPSASTTSRPEASECWDPTRCRLTLWSSRDPARAVRYASRHDDRAAL